MKFIIPIPDTPYYLWQALVQMASFRELGYEEDAHYPVVYFNERPSDLLLSFWESDEIRASLHLYPDTRTDTSYSASMKPWLMGKFFEQFPGESSSVYNYLDPDCVFTRPMDFAPFLAGGDTWYGSDTSSYTGVQYIRDKGEQLFLELCGIARLQQLSGAQVLSRAAALPVLRSGRSERNDPQHLELKPFPAVPGARAIADDAHVQVGPLSVQVHATPGHAPGSTSFSWRSCAGTDCRQVVYADSVSALADGEYLYRDHPDYGTAFKAGMQVLAGIEPCDILLTPHLSVAGMTLRLSPCHTNSVFLV